ncbi:unnamed protein product [Aphanomyces euteiches]
MQADLIFCDDFENDHMNQYYDYFSRWGRWNREFGKGIGNSWSMASYYGFYDGDKTGGLATPPHGTWLGLAFGKMPDNTAYKPAGNPATAERELYWRFYVKSNTAVPTGTLSSTSVLANVYAYGAGKVPFMNVNIKYPDQSGVLVSELRTGQFNSAGNPTGTSSTAVLTGTHAVMSKSQAGVWHQIQLHVKLNDAGQSNGTYELWVDGALESSKTGINWVGSYTVYGINAVQLYNTNNQPGVAGGDDEYRTYDNMMLSRQPIGDAGAISPDNAFLRKMTAEDGKITPAFKSNQLAYTVEADYDAKKVMITPVLADDQAKLRVDGKKHANNKPIKLDMKNGNHKLTIEVTARDGVHKKVYTIKGIYPKFNVNECKKPQSGWIFCDDFEKDRSAQYFEHTNPAQFYRDDKVGLKGSMGMKAEFKAANGEQFDTGALKVAFGRTPDSYLKSVGAQGENLREVYFRYYIKHQEGWQGGGGDKMARLTAMQNADWAQSMIAHVWSGNSDSKNYLVMEPASGTDPAGVLKSTKWNDFPNLRFLGGMVSKTPIYDEEHVGKWYSIEAHVKLSDAGQSNGVFEVWIDDVLEMSRYDLNWAGAFAVGPNAGFGLNWFALENYWNAGTPQDQERYFDNLVISRNKIGLALKD